MNNGDENEKAVEERLIGDLPLLDANTAAERIDDDATMLVSGFGSVGYPKAVPLALAKSDRDLELTIVSGGSVGEEIDVDLVEADAVVRRHPFQATREMRSAINKRIIAFSDPNVSSLADEVQYGSLVNPDVAVVEAVAVGEGWLIPSTSIGQAPAFVEAAPEIIVEVNRAQPLRLQQIHDVYRPGQPPDRDPIPLEEPDGRIGTPHITFNYDDLIAVVETDRPDSTYSFREPTEDDQAIATNFGSFLTKEIERSSVFEDMVNLQFGVGSMGNALMGELSDLDGDRDIIYFGEVIQDGLLDMLDSGNIRAASATSLALTESGQKRFFNAIERYAEDIVLRPTDVSNNPALIDRFGVIGVNSALEVDVYGNANSTHVNGSRIVNGIGGAGDFNRNALLSVCTLPSTLKDNEISRIVPKTFHTDNTEHDVDVIITEQGIADVRGCAPIERAERIIKKCVHPSFRPALEEYLDSAKGNEGHVPLDLQRAVDWPP